MSKPKVTAAQFEKLKAIEAAFSKNVIGNYSHGDAIKVFRKNASLKQIFNIMAARKTLASRTKKNAPLTEQAEALALYCSAALPVLKKAFGEDFLVRALPPEAKDQDIIDLCRSFGADGIAELCEKARKLPPAAGGPKPQS